jgi:hypothetical protein
MAKSRGGADKRKKRSAKGPDTTGKSRTKSGMQLAVYVTNRTQQPSVSVEKLRLLRHVRPTYLKTLLSKLLLVGEGRSRLSVTTPTEEHTLR